MDGAWGCLDWILPIQSRSRGRVRATYSRWTCSMSQSLEPGTTFRVYLDPAGHPFCLVLDEGTA